ncbi:hypothetical protein B4U80_05223, partial [Leptotrombidium deliense]
MRHSGERPYK